MSGGTPKPLPRGVVWRQRGAWGGDGIIWLTDVSNLDSGIIKITSSDSVMRPFGKQYADVGIVQILPGDRMGLALRQPTGTTTGPALIMDLKTGEGRVIIDEAIVEMRYGAGHLVYVLGDGTLHAVPFDERQGRLIGTPVTLARDVALTGTGLAQLAMAANGTVAFVVEEGQSLMIADRSGAGRPVIAEQRNFHHPRFSPDGRRIAIDFNSDDGRDVWILNLADSAVTRATVDRDGHDASWSPDGRTIAYTSFRGGVFTLHSMRPGSSDAGDSLLTLANLAYTGIWLKDGSGLLTVGQTLRPESGTDIAIVRNGGRGPVEPLVATRFIEQYPALSLDNEWIAFTSNQSGRDEVYVRSLAAGGEVIQVSLAGGSEPVWAHDGRELFYRGLPNVATGTEAMIMSAKISTRPTLGVTSREALFSASAIVTSNPHANYDVSPDGKRFVYVRSNPSSRVMVIQNLAAMVAKLRGGQGAP
jgi:serine/threonine-protein kinase